MIIQHEAVGQERRRDRRAGNASKQKGAKSLRETAKWLMFGALIFKFLPTLRRCMVGSSGGGFIFAVTAAALRCGCQLRWFR